MKLKSVHAGSCRATSRSGPRPSMPDGLSLLLPQRTIQTMLAPGGCRCAPLSRAVPVPYSHSAMDQPALFPLTAWIAARLSPEQGAALLAVASGSTNCGTRAAMNVLAWSGLIEPADPTPGLTELGADVATELTRILVGRPLLPARPRAWEISRGATGRAT